MSETEEEARSPRRRPLALTSRFGLDWGCPCALCQEYAREHLAFLWQQGLRPDVNLDDDADASAGWRDI